MEVIKKGADRKKYAVYDVPSLVARHKVLNVAAAYSNVFPHSKTQQPILSVHKYQTGLLKILEFSFL